MGNSENSERILEIMQDYNEVFKLYQEYLVASGQVESGDSIDKTVENFSVENLNTTVTDNYMLNYE